MSEITELIIPEHYNYKNYKTDQCVTTNINFFNNICEVQDKNGTHVELCKNNAIPYIFQPYTEDITIEKRASLLKLEGDAFKIWVPDNTIDYDCKSHPYTNIDAYHDDNAEEKYLQTTPTSYIIFSKPNIGETELAQLLSEKQKNVLITPESIIKDEIHSGSRVGKCIKFNLQNGRAIGPEVVLRLIERRIKSQTVQHRGFVIAGFPLIHNHLYKDDPLSSESAVFNVDEIFEDVLIETIPDRPASGSTLKGSKVTIDGVLEEDEVQEDYDDKEDIPEEDLTTPKKKNKEKLFKDLDLGPEIGSIIKTTESFTDLLNIENQLKFIFSLFEHKMIIIYITCGNLDVVNKTQMYRFDLNYETETLFGKNSGYSKTSMIKETTSETNFLHFEYGNEFKESFKLPIHLNESISAQLLDYKFKLQNFIERKILDHDPQFVIKVDGRLAAEKMLIPLLQRLEVLGLQSVLVPENLNELNEIRGEFDEEPTENIDEDGTPENAYTKLKSIGTVSRMYKWRLSHWGYKCPVAFKQGKRLKGKAQHAIGFMDKMYFLSDENAVLNFCRNPRPYLLPIKIKPTNRIFVMGPKYSGKTLLSKCLSFLFNSHVLDIDSMENQYKNKKKFEYLEQVRIAAITEGLLELQKLNEENRKHNIKYWLKNVRGMLLTFCSDTDLVQELTNKRSSTSIKSHLSEKTMADIQLELDKLSIAYTDLKIVKSLLQDDDKLLEYIPVELTKPLEPPSVHDSYITNYVNKILTSTVYEDDQLTPSEIIDMFQTAIRKFELHFGENLGWIVDGFPPEIEIIKGLNINEIADIVICLRDEDPENIFLLAKFAKSDNNENIEFKKFFKELRRFSAAERVSDPSVNSTFRLILENIKSKGDKNEDPFDDIETVQSNRNKEYANHLTEFNQRWFETQQVLSEICGDPPIEINIANKSLPELLKESILSIENKYKITANFMSDDDKMEELRDFRETIDIEEEREEEIFEDNDNKNDFYQNNRRYGNTNNFCPIAFYDYFVLWKGKEKFAATFENKTYLLSSEEALNAFVENPYLYLRYEPNKVFPPPRICITGAIGSGKTTLAKKIADNFGLFYVNFEDILLKAFNLDTITKVDDLLQHDKDDEEIYTTEKEILRNYYIDEENLLPEFYFKKSLDPLWHNSPYQHVGFVLDHFPRKANDLKYMKKFYYIPDVVIELEVNQKQLHDRLFNLKLNKWREELQLKKKQTEEENKLRLRKWNEEYESRVNFMREVLKDERKQEFLYSQPPIPPFSSPVDSTTMINEKPEEEEKYEQEIQVFVYDPVQENVDLEEIKKKVEKELPRPVFQDQWESEDEATERIEEMLNEIHVRDLKYLKTLKFELKKDSIDCISLLTDKEAQKIFLETTKILENYKFRNKSFFERVYSIAIDVAEKLLQKGYYFISKFGRTCPVQVYERKNPIQMYLSSPLKMNIFPLIYRRYIYFVYGKDHVNKFKQNPLMYVESIDYQLPLLPLRIAIIGPPKCGKSILADRFRAEYGLKVVTRGEAARYVLKHLANFELAKSMTTVLEQGWSLTYEMIATAVEAFTLDGKSITQGYILDGFPSTIEEMQHLKNHGIVPHICFYVSADEQKVKECTKSESIKKFITNMSHKFIQIRYKLWQKEVNHLTDFIKKEFQNIYWIEGLDSKWEIWNLAKNTFPGIFFDILNYFKNRYVDKAHHLKSLLITSFEFFEKQGCFQNFCPCCIYYKNHLVSGDCPPDRNGLVQYHDYYYWICNEHFDIFMNNPKFYTPPQIDKSLPENIPEIGTVCCVKPKCCSQRYYENGLCIICFWDHQPKRVINTGQPDYAALYNDTIYVFCSAECQKKFMKEPHTYSDKVINFRKSIPLELKQKLPIIGYLEQYVAEMLTRAVINTEVIRPVHPCMDIKTSTAIYLALYLKLHNPKTKLEYMVINKERMDKFEDRRKEMKSLIKFFLSTQNPFCQKTITDLYQSTLVSGHERVIPTPTEYTSTFFTTTDKEEEEKTENKQSEETETYKSENTLDDISFYGFED